MLLLNVDLLCWCNEPDVQQVALQSSVFECVRLFLVVNSLTPVKPVKTEKLRKVHQKIFFVFQVNLSVSQ